MKFRKPEVSVSMNITKDMPIYGQNSELIQK